MDRNFNRRHLREGTLVLKRINTNGLHSHEHAQNALHLRSSSPFSIFDFSQLFLKNYSLAYNVK